MIRLLKDALITVAACASLGCTTTVTLDHRFELIEPAALSPMVYEDESFSFGFTAVPSGVFFVVQNRTDLPAFIEWQNCFFVEPDGNTFNALNTDILDESEEVSERSAHRTQVPANSMVTRFTTATVNTNEHNLVSVFEIGSMLSEVSAQPDYGSALRDEVTVRATASFARSLSAITSETWSARRYWGGTLQVERGREAAALARYMQSNVDGRETIGLGLRIVHGTDAKDYRFKFALSEIFASVRMRSTEDRSFRDTVRYYATRDEDWVVRPIEEFGTAEQATSSVDGDPQPLGAVELP